MAVKIGVSTGVFYKHFKEEELNQMISFLKTVDTDIIEILYARPFMLDVILSEDNLAYLQTKEVLIHAPFFVNQGYQDVFYDELLIDKLIEKQRALNSKHIILHLDLLSSPSLIDKYPGIFVFENLKEERKYTLQKLLEMVDSGSKIKISLDIGHLAAGHNLNISEIIQKYRNSIAEIQLSIKEDYDEFLSGNISSKYSFLIGLDIPLILETRPKELSQLGIIINNLKRFMQG